MSASSRQGAVTCDHNSGRLGGGARRRRDAGLDADRDAGDNNIGVTMSSARKCAAGAREKYDFAGTYAVRQRTAQFLS